MKSKINFSFLLAFAAIMLTGLFCQAAERSSRKVKIAETDKLLSIFNVIGESVTGGKKPKRKGKTRENEVVFPENLIPTALRNEVSSKTIEAETFRITDSGLSKKQLLSQTKDNRQKYQPNYKLIAAIVLTVAYILCTFAVHRHHRKNLPKHT